MNFSKKTVVITGASSGIGYELSKLFARESCNLALLSRRKDITDHLAEELKNSGSKILSLKCDVTIREEVQSVFGEIRSQLGKLILQF